MKTKILILCMLTASSTIFAQKKEKDKVLSNKTYIVDFTETNAKKPKPVSDDLAEIRAMLLQPWRPSPKKCRG